MKNMQHFIDRLAYLHSRWEDESEYEDIADYLTAMQKVLPTATKMTTEPFGVIYTQGKETFHATIKEVNGDQVTIEIQEIGGAK